MKKYLLKAAAGMIVLAMFFLTGCETDNSVNFNEPVIRVVGTIHGVVTDAYNNARMEDVTVKVVQKNKMYTTDTDSLGYYIVDKLYSGTYEVTFHINGYAVSRAYGYIPTEEEIYQSKEDIYYNETVDMSLFGLNAGVTGKIYKVIEGQAYPAAGVTVYANFSHFDLHPDKYSVTTNTNGVYTFTNLPAAPMAGIMTLPYNDGTYAFDPAMTGVNLFNNVTVSAQDMGLFITDAPVFVLTHNMLEGFLIGGDIVITFNKAIDTQSFKAYLGTAKTEISAITWSNGNTTVTINPDENLLLDTWYELYFYGKSVDGNHFDYDYYFETQPGIEISRTNLEYFDEYYSITQEQNIEIVFTEPVISSSNNYFRIRSWDAVGNYVGDVTTDVQVSWSVDRKTLTITPPASPGYEKGRIRLEFVYYSNLGQDDNVDFDRNIDVR